ncbi:MAG: DUF1194 domain-containing protein [Stellaceae bacterium]
MRAALAAVAALVALSPIGAQCAAPQPGAGPHAPGVGLEVVLAADVSRSIDDGEFELQRKGYAAALTDPSVLKAIRANRIGAIAVCFVEWSGEEDQQVVLGWTEIRDAEDGGGAAATILKAPRSFTGRTSISAAIDFAKAYFAKAKWPASRRIIDISGDGTSNAGRPLADARDQAVAAGITINGLAIINEQADASYSAHTHPPGGLPNYYRQNVIGGPNSFLFVVKNFQSFAEAMANKLKKEIDIAGGRADDRTAALR